MATKGTVTPRFDLKRQPSAGGWARTDDDGTAEGVDEPSTPEESIHLPWGRIALSVVGTLVLVRLLGVPFPDAGMIAVIAGVAALWAGWRVFRKLEPASPAQYVVAFAASAVVTLGTFIALFVVVLYVWMIVWLKTTPM